MSERLIPTDTWQTQARGSDWQEYHTYVHLADNGKGIDITTGKPLKTFEEWLAS